MTAAEQREEEAYKRLFCGWSKGEVKPQAKDTTPAHRWPKKVFSLEGAAGKAQVVLEQKYGVWFVIAATGSLHLNDFASMKGWGDTIIAVRRCARHCGYTITDPSPDTIFPPASKPLNHKESPSSWSPIPSAYGQRGHRGIPGSPRGADNFPTPQGRGQQAAQTGSGSVGA